MFLKDDDANSLPNICHGGVLPTLEYRILAGLLKLPENKKCFDCPSKVNVYANLFNNTFICEKCSGLLRELNHRVKSISASTFTSEEIAGLQKGGNTAAKKVWLATWSWREYPEPDAHEVDEVRQFMRAKYIKKLWYQDPNGSPAAAPGSATPVLTSPTSSIGTNSGLAVPDRVRAISKSQHIDVNPHASSPSTPITVTPERTLSRKSSTLSSDSGSTTISKSTDPSSAGSSPFHPAGAPKTTQPFPFQFQSQQQQQQQQRQGSFDQAMGLSAHSNMNGGHTQSVLGRQNLVATPAATETSDPFSLMTNAFGNMGINSSASASINTNDAFVTPMNGGYAGHTMPTQSQASTSQAHSSNDFFSAFSQPTSAAAIQAASSDPFPLAASNHQQPVLGSGTGSVGGSKSFDDYLSVFGRNQQQQFDPSTPTGSIGSTLDLSSAFSTPATSTATLSPSIGATNPFGQQQNQQQPQQLQRAFTADYISTSTGFNSNNAPAPSQNNPFALFAKQPQLESSIPSLMKPSFSDPFGNMAMPQQNTQQQQQQQQDYFSTSGLSTSGTRSPNPFMMLSGSSSAPRSPFDQQQQPFQQYQQQQTSQPSFMRSASDSSYSLQNAFGNAHLSANNTNLMGSTTGSSSSIYESAFSMPNAPTRSMTVPAVIMSAPGTGAENNTNLNDMFGQWMKPAPVAATSKYPSIDDLDPFSSNAVPSSTSSTSAYSNPFSL
ncbi:hypothetical protein FBU30_000528 [Linnemannia zychae]|nr:hypothetical protein FBU30_000528 [Linnemannia zychae]